MPMSPVEGKSWIKERFDALAVAGPLDVLDLGPGVGTYSKLLAGPGVGRMVGVEIWAPYVHTYRLHEYYDEIIVGDAREVDLPPSDVVIVGDIAEHMSEADAVRLWARCAEAARRAVFLSIPIVHYPQGEIEGNPHETHVDEDWDHERVLATFPAITDSWAGVECGVYVRVTGG